MFLTEIEHSSFLGLKPNRFTTLRSRKLAVAPESIRTFSSAIEYADRNIAGIFIEVCQDTYSAPKNCLSVLEVFIGLHISQELDRYRICI